MNLSRHAWCISLFLPLSNFTMLSSGPHGGFAAMAWTLPVWLALAADRHGPSIAGRDRLPALSPTADLSLVALLALLQFTNIALMLLLVSELTWASWSEAFNSMANVIAVRVLTGTTSSCSGIALAHDLIHRRSKALRQLGRILLWTVLFDHFAIGHLRGHHRHVGTAQDFSTPRHQETFNQFWRRSQIGLFCVAWLLESARLARCSVTSRIVQHRVVHGLLAQSLLLAAIASAFGCLAMLMFIYQAVVATRLLEAITYIQHWELGQFQDTPHKPLAWSTRSWFSIVSLLGMPLHADHHRRAVTPFHLLQIHDDGPVLAYGYYVMAMLLRTSNSRFQQIAQQQLNSAQELYLAANNSADRANEPV